MSRLDEFREAAVESLWMCRLSESRLLSPQDPSAIRRYEAMGRPDAPWKYDYYSHVLAAQRLLNSAEAINEILADRSLATAIETFSKHWRSLRGLRNVLQHPKNTDVRWRDVGAFHDRIEYRLPKRDPTWAFTIKELHEPVEVLGRVICEAMARRSE